MTDKQRAEFVEKRVGEFYDAVADTWEQVAQRLEKFLLEYDKLNGDKLERLKEFVEGELFELHTDSPKCSALTEAQIILAEIERLEREGK